MIRILIKIYIFLLILDSILSYLPQYQNHPWAKMIKRGANFTLDPIRKVLPRDLPFDLSPLVVILILNVIMALW